MLDRAVDSYFPILDKILDLMEQVEDSVFDEEVESAQDLAILRRDIITQRRILFPMRTVMAELEVKLRRFAAIDMSVYFGDLIDHMNKICETLDECKEVIEAYKDSDWVLSTDRLNHIMSILTVIATIVLPFLVISSLYGMNVHMPGGITSGSWVPFVVIMLATTLIAGVILYIFRRKRWI
jgi:magnesium transporter